MKRGEIALIAVGTAFAAFVAVEAVRSVRTRSQRGSEPDTASQTVELRTQEGDLVSVRRSDLPPPPPKDYVAIGNELAVASGFTYIGAILKARNGHIARWVDRRNDPITVWIQRSPDVRDFWPDFPDRVRDAFFTWSNAGIPIRFLFIHDSTNAEVRVRWLDHFPDQAAGKTYWVRDVNWWILGADIELALHSANGEAYDRDAVHAIALHEVGHLIGLDHSPNPDDVMAPRVHSMQLSLTDLRTANLIYKLPPGAVADTARR
ncbi:MAG: matrixin family metalloprotease [Gemmatimonadaceae bacterium]|nr:matrixin family metalloprotease [Gemmatimonadaceae bacterium]